MHYHNRLHTRIATTQTTNHDAGLMLEVNGVVYVVADGYQGGCEKTFRLDRIREHWLDEKGTSRLSQGREAPDA
jgi:hypothetical protein